MTKESVLLFGTFDVLHPGHLRFLKWAARYGRIVVALTPDKMCLIYKNRRPCRSYEERKRSLQKISYVSKIVPADTRPGSFGVVKRLQPAVIVLGYDQGFWRALLAKRLKQFNLNPALIMLRPYRQRFYKTSHLRALAENAAYYATRGFI